ncbi:glutaminyl-tRNA synthetase [Klebsiella pneumoniae]|uniref:Glutaminyl-tRNA synthetase n=1 Tax=Klebsiella pneumoniae TaxID=573 RepID=A0A3S4KML3_KLEPN|nr:glutaminyl-tRNA synthetase [Klebsiella pneumoniae]
MKIWLPVNIPPFTLASAGAERLSAHWPCKIHLPELRIAQDYQGQCNLRFDDTNPVKEDIEYVESIKNDVQWFRFPLVRGRMLLV